MSSVVRQETKDTSALKKSVSNNRLVNMLAKTGIYKVLRPFPGSEDFWINRYDSGGTSGPGSYNHLAAFKADVLNRFVEENSISQVIEYGCGDGNQLRMAHYPHYIGFDISASAIAMCKRVFENDGTKQFKLMRDYAGETAELTLSLDVIFHLVEDEVFSLYMERLFNSSEHFVIIYSSNTDINRRGQAPHVRHRNFTTWIDTHQSDWKLVQFIPNRFPLKTDQKKESFSDFYVFERLQG